jgi:hypothetical protein
MAPRRYMTKFPANWVIPPNEPSVPVPRAPGGTTDIEVQHAQVNTETAALPTDSSALALQCQIALSPVNGASSDLLRYSDHGGI